VCAVLVSLQLDDDKVRFLVDSEEVDSALASVPIPELFRYDPRIGSDYVDIVSQ
jgi:hypothetical protein